MRKTTLTSALCALLLAAVPSLAQEGGQAPGQPEMTPEQQQMMEIWMKAMTPGAPHEHIARHAGDWEFVGKFWMEPGAPPEVSKGTSKREMSLGGRVMEERVESEMMGMPFHGVGTAGYDNVTGRYWSTWTDSMSTGVMVSYGTCDEKMTRCEFHGTYPDAVTGKMKETRMVNEIAPDREVMKSYEKDPDGKEFQTMELTFTRKSN